MEMIFHGAWMRSNQYIFFTDITGKKIRKLTVTPGPPPFFIFKIKKGGGATGT